MKRIFHRKLSIFSVLLILFCSPATVLAEAGQAIFVSGEVLLATGVPLTRGSSVSEGDEIVTGSDGRVQLLMQDGDRIAIRPNSRFLIETYQDQENRSQLSRGQVQGKRVYNLLKGGFRTLTGKKWAKDEDSYQVKTPVATIGVRGTDYEALLQEIVDSLSGFGLYLGVHDGVIWVRNNATTTDVYDGEYIYLESVEDPGVKLIAPPDFFSSNEAPPPSFWMGANASGLDQGEGVHESRRSPPEIPGEDVDPDPPIDPEIPVLAVNASGQLVVLTTGELPTLRYNAFASGPLGNASTFNGTALNQVQALDTDAKGDLTAFPGLYPDESGPVLGIYQLGSSQNVNQGFDPVTGLSWGRWSGGQAVVTHGNGTENIDLNNQSLHWIMSADSSQPTVLPISGSATYRLVGNTDPTDNFGNVGFMDGRSHLHADFTNQTIATELGVSINNQQWSAQDSNGQFGQNGTFAGQFDSVQVNGADCANGCAGQGGYSGFFTGGNGSQPPPGAGMGYNMEQEGSSVSGTAAFGDPQ